MQYGDLISVVIPCFNRARSIERAVRGVLLQSYPNLELIVVDDASTDASAAIVEAINDPRLRLIRHETNKGAAAARNTGVAAARGTLIAFQDSDDNWFPEKLDVQMRHFCGLPKDHVAVFCTKIIYGRSIDQRGRKTYGIRHVSCVPGSGKPPMSGDLSQAFLWGNFMGPPTVLLKAAAFQAAGGYDLRLRNNNDWDFHLRLSRIGPIGFIDEPLMLVYDSVDGISKNPVAKAFSTIVIFNKIRRYAPDAPALAIHAVAVHRHLMFKGKPRSARRFLHKALEITPGAWHLYLRLALTYFPDLYQLLLQGRRRGMVRRTTELS
jgi:glycosyltransferase involved in cell wall biosynthesis